MYLVESIQKQNKTLLYVFSRNDKGEKHVKTIDSFLPYFYVDEDAPIPENNQIVGIQKGYTSIDKTPLKKIYVRKASDVSQIRGSFPRHYEADILFPHRYMIDEIGEISPYKLKVLSIDIETNTDKLMPDLDNPNQEITSICMEDSFDHKQVKLILESKKWKEGTKERLEKSDVKVCHTEEDLLNAFVVNVNNYDPDIITGWNCEKFDLLYLIRRMSQLDVNYRKLSPLYSVQVHDEPYIKINIKGRILFDMMEAYMHYRRISNQGKAESYSLEFTGNDVLGEGKIKHDKTFREMWEEEPEKLIEYNMKDTSLVLRLDRELKIVEFYNQLRCMSCCQIKDVYFATRMIDGYLLRKLKDRIVLPSKTHNDLEKIDGAYVLLPTPAIYNNVLAFDVKCISEDTEILTDEGWKSIDSINKKDKALTFNVKNEVLEYNKINNIFKYDYEGTSINIKTNTTDQILTPNHRILIKKASKTHGYYNSHKYDFKQACSDFSPYDRILTCGKYFQGKTTMSDDMVILCGWIITEGHFLKNQQGIFIYQSYTENKTYCNEIKNVLDKLEIPYKLTQTYRKKENWNFFIPSKYGRMLRKILYKKKSLTRELLDLSYDQLNLLFKTMIKGDGYINKNGKYSTYITKYEKDANDFAELLLKIDRRPNIKKINDKRNGNTYYFVKNGEKQKYAKLTNKQKKYYKGRVWCINTKNGNFIAKRNGKTFITGNSMYPNIIKTFNISYETFNPNGSIFIDKNISFDKEVGIIPECVTKLGIERDDIKKLRAENVDNKTLFNMYNFRQYAIKVLMNSFYGYLGAPTSRLYKKEVASSITTIGRRLIKWTKSTLENQGYEVLYGDTDSCVYDTIIDYYDKNGKHSKKIGEMFEKSICDGKIERKEKNNMIVIPNNDMNTLSVNTSNDIIENKKIKYIMGHKVKKKLYKIKTNGKEVTITENHSIMVKRDGKIIGAKPCDIKKTDKLLLKTKKFLKNVQEVL